MELLLRPANWLAEFVLENPLEQPLPHEREPIMAEPELNKSQIEHVGQDQPLPVQEHKVVIHRVTGELIKGHLESNRTGDLGSLFEPGENGASKSLPIRTQGAESRIDVPLGEIKSVFFVKSFRGDSNRKDLLFYTNGPEVGRIWVEVRFKDDEVLEGLIENSVKHLIGDGFFLRPTDFRSNNVIVYVSKSAIRSFRVLGIRSPREFGS
jgi:hypothetical protein